MYIVGIAVCLLACGYGIYRYGMRRGVEVTFDFFIDNLETNGYVVNIYNEKVEVLPKYQKEWYHSRAHKEEF